MDFFWIIFLLISLQPVITRKMLESARMRMIERIEKERNSRVILLVHRQEQMSLLGFPLVKFINMEDSEEILRVLEMTEPERDIDLVLHTPGGLVLAAVQIARAINRRKGKVRVVVPHYAMSGGTLIALAADEIILSKNAVLGPVDPQLGEYPAPSLVKLLKEKNVNDIDDATFIKADIAEKAIRQLKETIAALLRRTQSEEKAKELASLLTEGNWTHDFPITCDYAKSIGLNVTDKMPPAFLDLLSMYPQPVKTQRSVEYSDHFRRITGGR